MLLVIKTNAVINPRTVVVHPHHTVSTHATVMCSWRLESVAFFAFLIQDFFNFLSKRIIFFSTAALFQQSLRIQNSRLGLINGSLSE